ncbi:hypothetical protein GH810_03335 [Acetobacterium paludosum]|uniref:Anti-sigma factor RsgI-like middle domain-containing protein n=1 Tax=Acetobacterium paludosum TaxID=52693 RepID=A0A923HT98_9FIRM|nr:hypothetical protein [Acetobacterium paludosum]MBC3887342.1 hypothetical protein [Acetobacterium paludosum]
MPDSIVALDVNPSIEIVTNKHNQVLSVKALNEDAQRVINGQNFDQADLEDSVDTLVSAMISHGYLNTDRNVVLVSVKNNDTDKADDLAVSVDQVIMDSASSQNIEPTVLRQTLTEADEQTSALADQYNVSTGKIKMIQEIASSDDSLSVDKLAAMSVTELLQVSKDKAVDLNKIIKFDNVSPNEDTKVAGQTSTGNATTTSAQTVTGTTDAAPVNATGTETTGSTVVNPTETVTTGTTAATPPVTPAAKEEPTVAPPTAENTGSATTNESDVSDTGKTTPAPTDTGATGNATANESDTSDTGKSATNQSDPATTVVSQPNTGTAVVNPTAVVN